MASSTVWKTIGMVKDQTSIGIVKVASNMVPDLEVTIVKATSHDNEPASEKHVQEILSLTTLSHGYVHTCVAAISKHLGKIRDWIIAIKTLALVHCLLADGDPLFQEEILRTIRKGARLLNMSNFCDEDHSSSWDHSAFFCTYAMYLDQRLDLILFDQKSGGGGTVRWSSHGRRQDFWQPPPTRML